MIFEYIKAVIYGIIEGITEWLPISSTGHLILFERLLRFNIPSLDARLSEQFLAMFDVVIQLGAVLAVVCVYFSEINPFKKDKTQKNKNLILWIKLIIATVPAALMGLIADKLCNIYLGKDLETLIFTPQTVASALIIYGILFILVEKISKNSFTSNIELEQISAKKAFTIGCFQALAIIPGTSRSGATILGARILGVPRDTAAKFSFFAAIPVISAASVLKIFDFIKITNTHSASLCADAFLILIVAGSVAFFTSLLVIKFLTDFVKRHSFICFGIYRIILGVLVLAFIK